MVAYKLILSEFGKAKLTTENIRFKKNSFNTLTFYDSHGLNSVYERNHSNLSIYECNDHVLCIVEEDQYSKPEIYNALCEFHSKNIDQEIERLKKIKNNL